MKVKVRKRRSPAPCAKNVSAIKKLRKATAYGVPIHVIYDRGYQQMIDFASKPDLYSAVQKFICRIGQTDRKD